MAEGLKFEIVRPPRPRYGYARVFLVRPEEQREWEQHPGYRGKILVADGCVWMRAEEVEVLMVERNPDGSVEFAEWEPVEAAAWITIPLSGVEVIEWSDVHKVEVDA